MKKLKDIIKLQEGISYHPYEDTTGHLTIGFGRNLSDIGITELEAEIMLDHDIADAKEMLFHVFPFFITEAKRNALVSMMFNLGYKNFITFKKMIEAVRNGNWDQAAKEMLDSKWAKQVGDRAKELSEMVGESK